MWLLDTPCGLDDTRPAPLQGLVAEKCAWYKVAGQWDTCHPGVATKAFFKATAFNQPLNSWNLSSAVSGGLVWYGYG